MYTNSVKKYNKLPINISDLYPTDPNNNPIASTEKTLNTSQNFQNSRQPYAHVPLLYYPIGNEREGYNNVRNNSKIQNNHKMNILYIFFIIFIIFIIYYLLQCKKSRK